MCCLYALFRFVVNMAGIVCFCKNVYFQVMTKKRECELGCILYISQLQMVKSLNWVNSLIFNRKQAVSALETI